MRCRNLRSVIFPDCLQFFDTEIFVNTSLESFKIPRNLERTGSRSFTNLTTLRKVDFSDATSIWLIYPECFSGCTAIAELDLRKCVSLYRIGSSSFFGCTNLTTIYLPLQASSLQIDENSFSNCINLSKIILVKPGLIKLNIIAFNGCSNLTGYFGIIKTCKQMMSLRLFQNIFPMILLVDS